MTKQLVRTDKNGTKYFEEKCRCFKCGGTGIYQWGAIINGQCQYSGVCYPCEGTGLITVKTREFTPEHEAKLQAQREKRQAKKDAEKEAAQAERDAKNAAAEKAAAERQAQIDAENAKSNYVGTKGDKVDLTVTLAFITSFEVDSFRGYGTVDMSLYGFKDDEGNVYVWKTSGALSIERRTYADYDPSLFISRYEYAHKGDRVHIKGTIKDHAEYKGTKQTVLTRVKLVEFIEKVQEAI